MAKASGLRILHLEDDAVDAELVAEALKSDGLSAEITRVHTRDGATLRSMKDLGDELAPSTTKLVFRVQIALI